MWQFIGVIVTILAAAIGILLSVRNQMRKSLSYRIVSCTPVMSVKKELEEKLQILYDGKPIKQAYVCVVKFINSGNVSIVPTDYLEKLKIHFGEKAQVLTSEIINQNPPNLDVSVAVERNRIVLSASMLNRTDSFSVKTVVTNYEYTSLGGRIIGIVEMKNLGESRLESFWYPLLMLTSLVLYAVSYAGVLWIGPNPPSSYLIVFAMMFLVSFAILVSAVVWMGYKAGRTVFQRIRKSKKAD
jgi:hypothetical protein